MPGYSETPIDCTGGMPGYLAMPDDGDLLPAVVVLHERYGFVRHPKEVAARFAGLGMAGLAINCFFKCDDQNALARGDARYFMTDPESVEYISAAIGTLEATGRVDTSKIAVLGMCQTGRHPLVFGAARPIAAALVWYGGASDREWRASDVYPEPLEDVMVRVDCPVMGLFGEADGHIPIENVRRFRNVLEAHGKDFSVHVYRDAPHGFLNDTMPDRYRHAEAEAGWDEMVAFLNRAFSNGRDETALRQRYVADISTES